MINSKLKFFSLQVIFISLFFAGCTDRNEFEFPVVYMYASLNVLTDAEYMSLSQTGNSLEILTHPNGDVSLGYDNNGIIIFNNGDSREPFYAFDRTCPHDLPGSFAIECNGNIATCPQCESVYVFPSEGIPATGSVSKYYLKKYRTSYNPNTGLLTISN